MPLVRTVWSLQSAWIQAPTDDPGDMEDFYANMPPSGGSNLNGVLLVLAALGFVGWLIYDKMQREQASKLRLEGDLRSAERERQELAAEVAELNERLRKRAEYRDLAERYKARSTQDAQDEEPPNEQFRPENRAGRGVQPPPRSESTPSEKERLDEYFNFKGRPGGDAGP